MLCALLKAKVLQLSSPLELLSLDRSYLTTNLVNCARGVLQLIAHGFATIHFRIRNDHCISSVPRVVGDGEPNRVLVGKRWLCLVNADNARPSGEATHRMIDTWDHERPMCRVLSGLILGTFLLCSLA